MEKELKTQIELATTNNKLRCYSFRNPAMSLPDLLVYAKTLEDTSSHAETVEGQTHVQDVNKLVKAMKQLNGKKTFKGRSSYREGQQGMSKNSCFKCGGEYPHTKICPAEGKICNNCKKIGHFAKCCRSQVSQSLRYKRDHRPLNNVTTLSNDFNPYDSTDSDNSGNCLFTVKVFESTNKSVNYTVDSDKQPECVNPISSIRKFQAKVEI